ncbi:hypothetical protein EVAR_13136_1 [Eumeta japonica]|uniref:Uncharacterized protein n=1 Tax=Eumeta variegata TaxID=151549 RepID=A0A4C1UB22_EUMVA|nr:hypothetical protein EVAR_13136_1 [Eumeta japonica]
MIGHRTGIGKSPPPAPPAICQGGAPSAVLGKTHLTLNKHSNSPERTPHLIPKHGVAVHEPALSGPPGATAARVIQPIKSHPRLSFQTAISANWVDKREGTP